MNRIIASALLLGVAWSSSLFAGESISLATGEWAPYTTANEPGFGVYTELVSAVFKEMKKEPKYGFYPWRRCYANVLDGVDFAAFPYAKTPEREQDVLFSLPLMDSRSGFYYNVVRYPGGIRYNDLKELRAYTLGGLYGYFYEVQFKENDLEVRYTSSETKNLQRLEEGSIDLLPENELVFFNLVKKVYGEKGLAKFKRVEKWLDSSPLYLIVSKRYPDSKLLLDEFNKALVTLKKNGMINRLLRMHGVES